MKIVTIDGMDEQEFRYSIEDMLRLDQGDAAIARLRALLESCAGVHETLPPRFREVSASDVEVGGWHRLADRLLDHDRPNHKVSAIGITLADARVLGGPGPARGRLAPFIKTFYFNDDAYPFSDATRDDLLDGYSRDGFEWQGDYQATDATLSIRGIDDLYGAIVELEDRLLDSADPDEGEIRAGTIGACYLAALIHQSLRETIRAKGLPRPLCVLAACDGVYPFFDAPVAGSDECTAVATTEPSAGEAPLEHGQGCSDADADDPAGDLPGMASLLSMVSPRAAKTPVMVLCEEDAEEALRYAERAEAERVGVEDGHALNLALAESQAALRAEAFAMSGEPEWGDVDVLEYERDGETSPQIASPAQLSPVIGFHPAVDDDEVEPVLAETSSGAGSVDWFESFAEPTEPLAPPASHSLRARIVSAAPEASQPARGWLAAVVDWFRRRV